MSRPPINTPVLRALLALIVPTFILGVLGQVWLGLLLGLVLAALIAWRDGTKATWPMLFATLFGAIVGILLGGWFSHVTGFRLLGAGGGAVLGIIGAQRTVQKAWSR